MDTFFWVGKNFQNKISKKKNICDIINEILGEISLWWVWLIYMHETVKLGVKIEKKGQLCFLSLKTTFCDLKLKLTFQPFSDTWKTRNSTEE